MSKTKKASGGSLREDWMPNAGRPRIEKPAQGKARFGAGVGGGQDQRLVVAMFGFVFTTTGRFPVERPDRRAQDRRNARRLLGWRPILECSPRRTLGRGCFQRQQEVVALIC